MNVLYHASPVQGLKTLKPLGRHKRRASDPPRIYVARQSVAVIFMVNEVNDSWSSSGSWDGRKSWWLVVGDEDRFRQLEQRGGSLYTVAIGGFLCDPDIGLGEEEFYATSPVQVVNEEKWGSALKAMLHYGLNVLFVRRSQFTAFRAHPNQWDVMQKARRLFDGTYLL